MSNNEPLVCLSTASNEEEAAKIGRALVEESLAACVNLVPRVRSIYRWEGKIEDASEVLLVIKTIRGRIPALTTRLKALHSYTVPELIALEVAGGNPDYLSWVLQSTR